MNQQRINRLIESRSLESVPATDDEVAMMWASALREWTDGSVQGLSRVGSFTHVYQAAFRAASALIRAAGYRPRGAVGGHHHVTFYVVAALGDEALEHIADAMQGIRGGRHAALYGDEAGLDEEDLDHARKNVQELLTHAYRWLVAARPGLVPRLPVPRSPTPP